jgi:ATP-dependent DNA ligase
MSKLPTIMPMLARLHREPFDGSEWVFEVKHDGFRAIAFIEDGHCRLISRNGYRFGGFRDLEESLGQDSRATQPSSTARLSVWMGKGAQFLPR